MLHGHVHVHTTYSYMYLQILYPTSTEWSFGSLFSHTLTSSCPLASLSQVVIEAGVVDGQPTITTIPSASYTVQGMGAGNDHIWMLYDVENATSV